MPKDSTPIDFAYEIHTELGDSIYKAIVNDEVQVDYRLKNKDRVRIITDSLSLGSKEEWIDIVETTRAKRKIGEFNGGDK